MLMAAVIGFTTASFFCGLAPTLPILILFRVIQGATGGALQPLSQAVMIEAFPPRDRGKAMAFWGLGIVVAPMLGPVIGGRQRRLPPKPRRKRGGTEAARGDDPELSANPGGNAGS
jgi:MFS family permease